jgi:hypothetical protein
MSLPGVKDVKIEAGDKAGTQKVTVTGEKTGITKEDAVKSLGSKAKRFVVKTWTAPSEEKES